MATKPDMTPTGMIDWCMNTPPEDIPEYTQYVDPRYSQQLMAESIPDEDLPSVSLPRKGPAVEAAPEAVVEPAVEAEQ